MNIGQKPIKSPKDSPVPNYNSVRIQRNLQGVATRGCLGSKGTFSPIHIETPKEFIAIPIATQCKCNQIDKSSIANIRQEQSGVCLCIIWITITGFTLIIILNIIARINTKK